MLINQPEHLIGKSSVIAQCQCGKQSSTLYKCYLRSIKKYRVYRCHTCAMQVVGIANRGKSNQLKGRKLKPLSESTKIKLSKSLKLGMTEQRKQEISLTSKNLWTKSEFRNKIEPKLKTLWSDPVIKTKAILGINSHAKEYSERMKQRWLNDPEWRIKCINHSMVSTQQQILYGILSDLGIEYTPEFDVGFWTFDCMIKKAHKDLLIEVQGDYWHNRPNQITRDQQKSTFISTYYSNQYELKTIWEHEFKTPGRVKELITQWCNVAPIIQRDFDFKNIQILKINEKEANIFCGKYHYFANSGRSGQSYAAVLDKTTIAVAVFAAPTRQETVKELDLKFSEVRELSRFCISDTHHKKNFASWALSRFCKLLFSENDQIKAITTFADESFGHIGTIYKATNWKFLHIVKPDYHYQTPEMHTMHKKTLWDHAKKMLMTENEYATKYGYIKVPGKQKRKFVLYRPT